MRHQPACRPHTGLPPSSLSSMRTSAASAAAPGGGDAAGVPEAYVELAHRLADAAALVTRRYFRRVLPSYPQQGRSAACFGHGYNICYHELAQVRPGSRQAI